MKALVTGGAGFIGSHLCRSLIKDGYEVVAVDNFSNGTKDNIKDLLCNPDFCFYECDINQASQFNEVFEAHTLDIVFHLAANADVYRGTENYKIDLEQTFQTTIQVLEMMYRHHVKKLFFSSSSTIYGNAPQTIKEIGIELKPISHYGAAKMASEAFISSFSSLYGIQVWIARFCNVVGPNMTHGIIPDLIRKLKENPKELMVFGNGTQSKPYIYIDDLISGIMCMISKTDSSYNTYLLGVDSSITVSQIAYIIMEKYGTVVPIRYNEDYKGHKGDVVDYKYDVSRLQSLGWYPKYTAEEAIRKAVSLNMNCN